MFRKCEMDIYLIFYLLFQSRKETFRFAKNKPKRKKAMNVIDGE